jgi:hypothetical protein
MPVVLRGTLHRPTRIVERVRFTIRFCERLKIRQARRDVQNLCKLARLTPISFPRFVVLQVRNAPPLPERRRYRRQKKATLKGMKT